MRSYMQTTFYRILFLRVVAGLALILLGAALFTLTAPDSWRGLTALLASLGGLALLYGVVRLWRERFGDRSPHIQFAAEDQRVWVWTLLRVGVVVLMVVAAGFWTWCAAVDMNEVRLLLSDPHYGTAQVVGKEIVRNGAVVGYIHYSYRVTPTLAPESRFAVARSDYAHYRIGAPLDITYANSAPRVHRLTRTTWEYGLRRALYWLLLLTNGAAYFMLPYGLIRRRERALIKAR